MARYDSSYITSLLTDIRNIDSDACAGLFAATYQEVYRQAYKILKNTYDAQDVLEIVYAKVFTSCDGPIDGRAFLKALRRMTADTAADVKAKTIHLPEKDGSFKPLSEADAEYLLHYIFTRVNIPPSELPLSEFIAYNDYRKNRSVFQRVLLVIILLVVLAIPLIVMPPSLSARLSSDNENQYKPIYVMSCKAFFPIESLIATIDGQAMPVSENADGTFNIQPTLSGQMDVSVKLVTSRSQTITLTVPEVDYTKPTISKYRLRDKKLLIDATDAVSGIDYDTVYCETPEGEKLLPDTIDKVTGTISFDDPETNSNIYLSDYAGNTMHLIYRKQQTSPR